MKKANILFSIVFLLIIFGFFLIDIFTPDLKFSYFENRTLQQKPKFTWETIKDGSFMEDMEVYVNDQIKFRDDFVQLSTKVKLLLGQKEINGVYFSNDFLVERFKLSDIDIGLFEKNKLDVQKFLDKHKNCYFLLVPTAGGVIDGLYPRYSENISQKEMITDIYGFVGEGNCVNIYDLLYQHQSDYIYYRTDHHWTTLGAYYGYVSVSEKMGLQTQKLSEFDKVVIETEFEGTIQSKINYSVGYDIIEKYEPKRDISYVRILNEDTRTESNTLYDDSKLFSKEKYAVFLGGNNPLVRIKIENGVEDKGKLLIIKDSFSHCFAPFIINHYSEVVLLDLRYYMGGVEKFLKSENFDDILIMYNLKNFVEDRNLIRLNK